MFVCFIYVFIYVFMYIPYISNVGNNTHGIDPQSFFIYKFFFIYIIEKVFKVFGFLLYNKDFKK